MQKGFNSDIRWQGSAYHVQTEDWGRGNPFFVSRIYRGGAVIKSVKTPYKDVLPKGLNSTIDSIQLALKHQHDAILDLLLSGQLL